MALSAEYVFHDAWYVGNAVRDDVRGSGWFVGQFVPSSSGLRHQEAVELKWGCHRKGERRPQGAAADGRAVTISVLVRGALLTRLQQGNRSEEVILRKQGDYLIFGPDVVHAWEALEDSVVLSVRFPSLARDGAIRGPHATGQAPAAQESSGKAADGRA